MFFLTPFSVLVPFGISLGINILTLGMIGVLGMPGFCALLLISALLG